MNNLPQIFNFNGVQVRTVNKNGEPWFVLKDVCDVLGLRSPDVRQRLSDDVVSTHTVTDSIGRTNAASIINEDGLYDVILESRKPEARSFRKWVTSEVLPSIRKHGAYMTPATIEKTLTDPDFIIKLATAMKEEQQRRIAAETKIEIDRPKVIFAEALETSNDTILIGELAKLLRQNGIEIGEKRLFALLRDEGYLGKKGEYYNIPTQRSMELGLFQIQTRTINSSSGSKVTKTTKVTGKGQIYFINKFKGKVMIA